MADHASVMIWVTDPTGALTYVNERWCLFTGTAPEESLGLGWLESVHPEDREKAGSACWPRTRRTSHSSGVPGQAA